MAVFYHSSQSVSLDHLSNGEVGEDPGQVGVGEHPRKADHLLHLLVQLHPLRCLAEPIQAKLVGAEAESIRLVGMRSSYSFLVFINLNLWPLCLMQTQSHLPCPWPNSCPSLSSGRYRGTAVAIFKSFNQIKFTETHLRVWGSSCPAVSGRKKVARAPRREQRPRIRRGRIGENLAR